MAALLVVILPLSFAAAPPVADSGIKIELIYGKQQFTYIDKQIKPSNHLIAEEIYNRKINGDYTQKKQMMSQAVRGGGTFKYSVLYTMPLLQPIADKAINAVKKSPVDSQIEFDPDAMPMFTITKETPGRAVNEEKLYRDIYFALQTCKEIKVTIKPQEVVPAVTAEHNKKLTTLRAKYTTGYAHSGENRKHNIRLALKNVNGIVIEPEAEFSFNKTVGKRTEKNGFKEGTIILFGKYEKGVGGGVCQVSTTVYNAALLSGLKITAARAHSLECAYEMPSFDAMVNEGSQDLRFKNTGDTPVFIRAYGTDTTAYVEVYGEELPYQIRRRSEIIHRRDPPLPQTIVDFEYKYHDPSALSGEQKVVHYPHGELKSAGYLLYYDNSGRFMRREKIREDVYKESAGLIAVAP